MNRRKFAFSWGRKIFFGISWPLSTALTLVYLRSFILPETATDWFYFLMTLIGDIGLLNAAFYFLLYSPVALIFPTYYIARIWSLLLVLVLNLFILVDAISFSSYHLHIYSYLSELYLTEGLHHLIGSLSGFGILVAGLIVMAGLIWIRGEMIWRGMQARFSNPISNWYLLLIAFCLGIGKLLFHYADIHPKFAELFPFNLNFARVEREYHENRKFYYPRGNLECSGKQNPNVVLIVFKEVGKEKFTQEDMPHLFHMKRHALSFNDHVTGHQAETGAFTLFYSVPASYQKSVGSTPPAIYTELSRRNYQMGEINHHHGSMRDLSEEQYQEELRKWMDARTLESSRPYFLSLMLERSPGDADRELQQVVLSLQKRDLLKKTHLIITAAGASTDSVPLLWITPERKSDEFMHSTSHYDLMPTLMQKLWSCRKAFKVASVGRPLEEVERDWVVFSEENSFKVRNFKTKSLLVVDEGAVKAQGNDKGRALIFNALRTMTKFYRPE
jgi:membrane-anchored protein YejM (alkaline phosphatase superfamily)